MVQFVVDHWQEITGLAFALLSFIAGRASGARKSTAAAQKTDHPDSGNISIALLLIMLLAACSASWIQAARSTVDTLSASTNVAWREYVVSQRTRCADAAKTCAHLSASSLDTCATYQECTSRIRAIGQAVAAFHETVSRTRVALDAAAESDQATTGGSAKGLYLVVLRQAAAITAQMASNSIPGLEL